jgi:hypothetical protein
MANPLKCSLYGLKIRDRNDSCLDTKTRQELIKVPSSEKCNGKELCLIKNAHIKNKYYLPKIPNDWVISDKNPNLTDNWLSNFDINHVLKQYEFVIPDYKFIGAFPIDFAHKTNGKCFIYQMCDFNNFILNNTNYTKYGIVFNTAKSFESGQHWISMFININNRKIYFFDSSGEKSPKQINAWIKSIPILSNFEFKINKLQHQFKKTECGVYSVLFIISLAFAKNTDTDKIWNLWQTQRLPDDCVYDFRKKLYR